MWSDAQVMTSEENARRCLWIVESSRRSLSNGELSMAVGGPLVALAALPAVLLAAPVEVAAAGLATAASLAAGATAAGGAVTFIAGAFYHAYEGNPEGARQMMDVIMDAAGRYLLE